MNSESLFILDMKKKKHYPNQRRFMFIADQKSSFQQKKIINSSDSAIAILVSQNARIFFNMARRGSACFQKCTVFHKDY